MSLDTLDPGYDNAARAVDFGALQYDMFFGSGPHCRPLPSTPPPAATGPGRCACPSCESEGWYAESPACRYWRSHCGECDGQRSYPVFPEGSTIARRETCPTCTEAWVRDVAWFRFAVRYPRAAAQELRIQAERERRGLDPEALLCRICLKTPREHTSADTCGRRATPAVASEGGAGL